MRYSQIAVSMYFRCKYLNLAFTYWRYVSVRMPLCKNSAKGKCANNRATTGFRTFDSFYSAL